MTKKKKIFRISGESKGFGIANVIERARDFNRVVKGGIDLKSQNYIYNLYFRRVIPITMKSILPSGPIKTKLTIRNYNDYDKKPLYK